MISSLLWNKKDAHMAQAQAAWSMIIKADWGPISPWIVSAKLCLENTKRALLLFQWNPDEVPWMMIDLRTESRNIYPFSEVPLNLERE
jgi:hypothetical protein